MELEILQLGGRTLAILADNSPIHSAQDALNLLMNARYKGAEHSIIKAESLHADFWQLQTMLAGDILQKFSTYDAKLSIIGDFQNIEGKSLKSFIYESNKIGRVTFISSIEELENSYSN